MTPSILTDALLLYVVAYCTKQDGSATLRGIFAACDAIDRSAPTLQELESGLGRLVAADLLVDEDGGFAPSGVGSGLYRKVNEGGGNVLERLEKLAAALVERYGSIDVGARKKLDPGAVEEARRSYYRH